MIGFVGPDGGRLAEETGTPTYGQQAGTGALCSFETTLESLHGGGEVAHAGHFRVGCVEFKLFRGVLVRRVAEEQKTKGGIIIPDTAKEKPSEGEIISVGTGVRGEDGNVTPLDVKAGDRVLFSKYGGTEVKVDGEDLIILRESDILGIIEGKVKAKKAA